MGRFRHFLLIIACWTWCSVEVRAQEMNLTDRPRSPRLARTVDSEQLAELFITLERLSELQRRQRATGVNVGGVLGFLSLTLIELPAVSASFGFVSTRGAATTVTPTNTATEAWQRLEKVYEGQEIHPLKPWIEYASARHEYVLNNIRDHTCVLIKRERIHGVLSDYEHLYARSRYQQVRNQRVVVPQSIFLQYLGPSRIRGRKVLYVAGSNDNKMLVRNGGRRFRFVTVKIDPHSDAARKQSHYPITELGIDNVIKRLIEKAQHDMAADSDGRNTQVEYFQEAKINRRACIRLRVTHPQPQQGLNYHRAEIYIDDQLQVPIHIEAYDWPQEEGQPPPLIEQYTNSDLKFNVGLKQADFLPRVLQ